VLFSGQIGWVLAPAVQSTKLGDVTLDLMNVSDCMVVVIDRAPNILERSSCNFAQL
jgi:hypothetical protein